MAELTEARRRSLLVYCHAEDFAGDADVDALIFTCYAAAVGYMEQAGVSEPADGTFRRAMYDLCINHMVLDAYDRRDATLTGSAAVENPAFRQMLNQLKMTEPEAVSDSDTASEEAGDGV